MTNKRVVEINEISYEVRRRRWNWLGHILRKEGENDCFTALGWIPEGRRTKGRAKKLLGEGQWRKTETNSGELRPGPIFVLARLQRKSQNSRGYW